MPTPGISNYPTALDTTGNLPDVSGANLADPDPYKIHSNQHDTLSQAVIGLEAKVGVGTETAGAATTGDVLTRKADGTTAWEPNVAVVKYPVVFATDSWTAIPNGGTPLVGTYRWYFKNAATLSYVHSAVGTAPATTAIQIRIKKNASSIISGSSYPQINVGSNVQTNTGTFTSVAFAAGDYLSIDIFQGDGAKLLVQVWFTEP